jgi:hypothetical protein
MSPSIFCSSCAVPRVLVTIPWVSPRVKSALPCTRGSSPTSQAMGRTVVLSRPSMRIISSTIIVRITLPCTSLKASFSSPSFSGNSGLSASSIWVLSALNFP